MLEINYASSDYDARCPPTVWGHQGSLQVLVHSIVATRPRYNHSRRYGHHAENPSSSRSTPRVTTPKRSVFPVTP